jgi:hypothetical protein
MFFVNETELMQFAKQQHEQVTWLLPDFNFESPYFGLEITKLFISTELLTVQNYNDDVWTTDCSNYFFEKSKLDQIACAGGVKFISSNLGRRELDEVGRPIYESVNVEYVIVNKDGEVITGVIFGEYSYFRDLQSVIYRNGFNDRQERLLISDIINRRRSNAFAFAEADAKRKILTYIFHRLKRPFSIDELNQPIIIGKIVKDKVTVLKDHPELQPEYAASMVDYGSNAIGRSTYISDSFLKTIAELQKLESQNDIYSQH